MRGRFAGCVAAAVMALSGPALAHHSAAGIDRSKSVTLIGTVRQLGWTNPHSWMEVDVPAEAGVSVTLPTGQTLGERAVLPAPAPATP